jgi:hypothetical protein
MRHLLVMACVVLALNCRAENTYTISGTVVAGNTGKPLKHVHVMIISVANQKLRASCITGEDGRFTFSNLPPAKFSFIAERQGGIIESFHQDGNYSTAIVTGPGLKTESLMFPLTTLGSISGSITSEEGDPVRDAQVLLFHRGIFSGKLQTQFQQNAQTDSSGNFHFGQLMPGTYFLGVQARPWYAQNGFTGLAGAAESPPNAEFDVAYPVTYYDGETDPNSASAITLSEGSSSNVNITLRAIPAIHVQISSAVAENGASAVAENGNRFNLFVPGPGGYLIPANADFMGSPNHEELTGIVPGRYVVERHVDQGGGRKIVDLSGGSTLDARDIPESAVSGQLSFEGNERPGAGVAIMLSNGRQGLRCRVAQDGSFSINAAATGRYEVQIADAPGYYVKSVSVGERPSPDGEVDVTEGSSVKISVIAAKDASNVDGVALKDGAHLAGAMVLLFPQNLHRTDLIRRDQSDSDGTFTLQYVPPGRYTLLAIDDGRDLAYAEPGAINPYLADGQIIDVPVSNGFQPSVKVQHRQR